MRIFDSKHSMLDVPHGMGPGSRLFLVKVSPNKKTHHSFIVIANNSRDARARVKRNAQAVISKIEETHWEGSNRTLGQRLNPMRQILAAIKYNKVKMIELNSSRCYPVSHFDSVKDIEG